MLRRGSLRSGGHAGRRSEHASVLLEILDYTRQRPALDRRVGTHENQDAHSYTRERVDQQRTIFDESMPRVAFRVSTTSCASRTMAW